MGSIGYPETSVINYDISVQPIDPKDCSDFLTTADGIDWFSRNFGNELRLFGTTYKSHIKETAEIS